MRFLTLPLLLAAAALVVRRAVTERHRELDGVCWGCEYSVGEHIHDYRPADDDDWDWLDERIVPMTWVPTEYIYRARCWCGQMGVHSHNVSNREMTLTGGTVH